MRSIAVLLVIGFVAAAQAGLTEEQKTKLIEHYKVCTQSTGVDTELVNKARKGEFVDDPKLKEFFNCMFMRIGFINEAGEVQLDVLKAKMPTDVDKNEAEKVITACKDKKGNTPGETSYELFKCYWETTPNHITLA